MASAEPPQSPVPVGLGACWPPDDAAPWPPLEMARALAAEAAAVASARRGAPGVSRALVACERAVASCAAASDLFEGGGAGACAPVAAGELVADNSGCAGTAEVGRNLAGAVLALHGVSWESRIARALALVDQQGTEFTSQLERWRASDEAPVSVQRVATEQLLDAVGSVATTAHGLVMQAAQEVESHGRLFPWTVERLSCELRRLPPLLATWRRWGLEVPGALLSVEPVELTSTPLAATDPVFAAAAAAALAAAAESGEATHDQAPVVVAVQRVVGALVVAGGSPAVAHVAWVDFDADGEPMFPACADIGHPIIEPPRRSASGSSSKLDEALRQYEERVTTATGHLVPAILRDVAAYAAAMQEALEAPGATAAVAELLSLCPRVPQPCDPSRADGADRGTSGLAHAREVVALSDPDAPPPSALEHVVHKQLRAVAGSKRLYALTSEVARGVGTSLVVLPGGVKKLPRTLFKCAVNYMCDLSQIVDQVRCTVVCDTLPEVAAVLREILACADLSVVRVKNRFAPGYDAAPTGGYLDLQTTLLFDDGDGHWMLGEVQVNLWSMLRIKEAPDGGHRVFKFARSLRAYDTATTAFTGHLDSGTAARIAAGALLTVNLGGGGCAGDGTRPAELGSALGSAKCRVVTLALQNNGLGDVGLTALAPGLGANRSLVEVNLGGNAIGDTGAAALSRALTCHPTAKALILSGNMIGDAGATALAGVVRAQSALTTLVLDGNKIGDAGATSIARALLDNKTLATLELASNVIGPAGVSELAHALDKGAFALSDLGLRDNASGNVGAAALAAALASNPRIRRVRLYCNSVGDIGAAALATMLKTNKAVTELDLEINRITDTGAVKLAGALGVNLTLTRLLLDNNTVGDAGASALAGALAVSTSMRRLSMYKNKVGDSGAGAFARALDANPQAAAVDLRGNRVGPAGRAALAAHADDGRVAL